MAIVNITDNQFKDTIKEGLVLVDFWAPWCGPCKMIAPVLEELSDKMGGAVTIAKINVDDNPQTAGEYGVMSIPTLMLFKEGEAKDTYVGFRSLGQLEAEVKRYL
ncbi:thioredoxin [Paenibacillus alkalitolerans]|uniref:thioredoxin n=1 Tax=Paenibacillus alkalitolerans TaxID=2799335 RepID=UPI0018F65274|nr:thioredoxin [Paenibacillus alkalitolerans]